MSLEKFTVGGPLGRCFLLAIPGICPGICAFQSCWQNSKQESHSCSYLDWRWYFGKGNSLEPHSLTCLNTLWGEETIGYLLWLHIFCQRHSSPKRCAPHCMHDQWSRDSLAESQADREWCIPPVDSIHENISEMLQPFTLPSSRNDVYHKILCELRNSHVVVISCRDHLRPLI